MVVEQARETRIANQWAQTNLVRTEFRHETAVTSVRTHAR
jgi:hypothetical protein